MSEQAVTVTQPKRQIIPRKIDLLLLDPENPRLAMKGKATQEKILQLLAKEALEELALSFVRNGYFWEEPVVVVPTGDNSEFVVVEGNRRVATIKLLLDPAMAKHLGLTMPDMSLERADELRSVPTVTYPSRDAVVPYLGFRHITGVKTWEPYAKARYIAELIEKGMALADIEDAIGDSARTAKKLYQAYLVYQQACDDLDYDEKSLRDNFSLFEVALGQQSIKEKLGLPRQLPSVKSSSLIPQNNLPELRNLLSYVFGDKKTGESKVITDSRQIPKRLAPIVADVDAYEYLKQTRDLEGSYERSGGELQFLIRQLQTSRRAAERALGVVPNHKKNAEVAAEAERLQNVVSTIAREVRA